MIIVQLKGGLGNQLFQYAAGLSLAAHHNTNVKVDTRLLNKADETIGTIRTFDLQQLILEPEVASANEIMAAMPKGFAGKLFDNLQPAYKRKIYKETDFCFDTYFFKADSSVYLKGYRQSEQYFLSIEDKIRNGFQFKEDIIKNVKNKVNELSSQNSISIHIRRGDYSNPTVRNYHGILEKDFYQQAIRYMESKITNPIFYIFSEDIGWIKSNLEFTAPVEFVSGNYSQNHYEDFHLISQCKHQIIANSTFSWWAAWLNPNPNKIVIAPKKWFNNAPYDTKDLIPESWIKL